jgi:ABC-type antimicrobial peptide transport system ATPase subunit
MSASSIWIVKTMEDRILVEEEIDRVADGKRREFDYRLAEWKSRELRRMVDAYYADARYQMDFDLDDPTAGGRTSV